ISTCAGCNDYDPVMHCGLTHYHEHPIDASNFAHKTFDETKLDNEEFAYCETFSGAIRYLEKHSIIAYRLVIDAQTHGNLGEISEEHSSFAAAVDVSHCMIHTWSDSFKENLKRRLPPKSMNDVYKGIYSICFGSR